MDDQQKLIYSEQVRIICGRIGKAAFAGKAADLLLCLTIGNVADRFYIVTWFTVLASPFILAGHHLLLNDEKTYWIVQDDRLLVA